MKLIMERFEKFSEKTIQEQNEAEILNEKMPKFGLISTSAIKKVKAKIGDGMRFGQMMDDDVRKHKDFAKYYQRDFGLAMQMAEKEAFRTPYSGNLKPRQIAQLATNDFFNSFRTKSPHYNKGIGARGREKRLRPIILSAFMSAASEVMGAMDTPDRAAGDIPDSPVRKPISPLDTTQQGGMMGKIAQTNRIIKKLGRRIGVRTAADLNDKLARAGYEVEVTGEVTADTIKAVKAFQKEYNMSRARGRRRPLKPDGLFGGKTARAFRRFKK